MRKPGEALARVKERHAPRADGNCVMCRWPNGELVKWPCPDLLDAEVLRDLILDLTDPPIHAGTTTTATAKPTAG